MRPHRWSGEDLVEALLAPGEPEVAGTLVVIDGPVTHRVAAQLADAVDRLALVPCVVVAPGPHPLADAAVADDAELAEVVATCERAPLAATALAVHLRSAERRPVAEGLAAESALYSTLQAGPEHRAWRQAHPPAHRTDLGPRVRTERVGDDLRVVLAHPEVRNALDAAMRDELLAALAVAEADPSVSVTLRGDGPSFCAGGHLDEFGTAPDPAAAHLIRLRRSIAAVLHRLAPRTTVHVHGACAGSGVELPAFAGRVVAAEDTTFLLPELALGLIPGAGGTVSLPRRIGRHRTAWLALTGRSIDAGTARAWGLVDEIALI